MFKTHVVVVVVVVVVVSACCVVPSTQLPHKTRDFDCLAEV